ncbi:ExbD/TolR family protein [Inmirania thermothiophila]|uniref:Biopolymer transport protein ExbD n=1 Tax=Inmirania thermothiophila TaxID=1750597 RepID=A0A3N1XTB5_9GAMM|nr:biopolymer transporter ExbD [Inmirania thermothiophila]ROR29498.1 biopolymer transport protein ExbD [Inmirania thermothiophila]
MSAASRRARRMARRHARGTPVRLHLVSLMDIFTILVFFLLVNTSDVQPPGRAVRLPTGRAETPPRQTLVVTVTPEAILVQDRPVVRVAAIPPDGPIAPLAEELAHQAARSGLPPAAREATVVGDRTIPFALLQRVMQTLSAAGYPRISLAVVRREGRS